MRIVLNVVKCGHPIEMTLFILQGYVTWHLWPAVVPVERTCKISRGKSNLLRRLWWTGATSAEHRNAPLLSCPGSLCLIAPQSSDCFHSLWKGRWMNTASLELKSEVLKLKRTISALSPEKSISGNMASSGIFVSAVQTFSSNNFTTVKQQNHMFKYENWFLF